MEEHTNEPCKIVSSQQQAVGPSYCENNHGRLPAQIGQTIEVTFMSRRLDYGYDFRKRQAAYGLSVKDEAEWMKNDAAARWLRRNGYHASQKPDHRASPQQPAFSGGKVRPAKRPADRHAELDPCDPRDQLAGVDMRQLPWG
jgi:hypothetical protein